MNIDLERQAALERDKVRAEAEIERLLRGGTDAGDDSIRRLKARIADLDERLNRMELAAELEQQSDA